MSDQETTITREQLYRMVWTRPFVRLAQEIGYSYLELVEICTDLNIPRPSGGYWYRQKHGVAEEMTPLSRNSVEVPTKIPLGPRRRKSDESPLESVAKDGEGEPLVAEPAGMKKVTSESPTAAVENTSEGVGGNAQAQKDVEVKSLPKVPVRMTRNDLYESVWKTPMRKLVVELGTTHAELIRVCEELKVPRPDQSYWSRLHLNLKVEVPPLPQAEECMATECLIRPKGAPKPRPLTQHEAADTTEDNSDQEGESVAHAAVERPVRIEYTREQLYEAIWSNPCMKLAGDLGISDVALAKTCRRLGIPRPHRGYWARREAGEKLKKAPLPVIKAGQDLRVVFDVAKNVARREEWALNNLLTVAGEKCRAVELPPQGSELHPIAERHLQALEKAKPGELGFVAVKGRELFVCEATAAMAPRLVRALHAVVCELEDRDFEFTPGRSGDEGLRLSRDGDHASLRWREAKLDVEREPTPEDKRRPSWTWQLKETRPAGELSVEVLARIFHRPA